jgi:hypothetical protein
LKKRLLRIFRGALGVGGTFFIACAYGPVDNGLLASGRVVHDGEGLDGLDVCARISEEDHCVRSGPDGAYEIGAPPATLEAAEAGFTLCADDGLGITGGTVARTCVIVPKGPAPFTVDIEMEEP